MNATVSPAKSPWSLPTLALLLIVGVALLASSCSGTAVCDVCRRDECAALAFRIEYADGGAQETCCPRCGSHAVAESGGRRVARLLARDFATGHSIDARTARYVEGSDLEHCAAARESRSSSDCCRVLEYDRCLPSLVAFATDEQAAGFVKQHGGRPRRFEDLRFGERSDHAVSR
jgi:hypothetical protein